MSSKTLENLEVHRCRPARAVIGRCPRLAAAISLDPTVRELYYFRQTLLKPNGTKSITYKTDPLQRDHKVSDRIDILTVVSRRQKALTRL